MTTHTQEQIMYETDAPSYRTESAILRALPLNREDARTASHVARAANCHRGRGRDIGAATATRYLNRLLSNGVIACYPNEDGVMVYWLSNPNAA